MRRTEWIALGLATLILVGLPFGALGYEHWLRPALSAVRVVDIVAAAPEAGGFQPESIQVAAGETVTLRFHGQDVTHGIAIGPGLGVDLGHVDPGHVKEVTMTFDEAGTFTFYCNTWCSKDHWRMRGVIEVRDPANPLVSAAPDPVIAALVAEGIDIDSYPDNAPMLTDAHGNMIMSQPEPALDIAPSAERGAALLATLNVSDDLRDLEWQRTHSPAEALTRLTDANPGLARAELADVIAALWTSAAPDETARALYNANCAACHGQTGGGDGPAANTTAELPTALGDGAALFAMRADVLYAKIRRGGMGTDMPNFGTLFTPDETWALVDYVWLLAFRESSNE